MADLRFSLPPVPPPSPAVAAEIARLYDENGPCYVAGRYIPNGGLADAARRREAERRVEAAARAAQTEAAWLNAHRVCPWCRRPVRPGTPYEVIGGEPVHARPCLVELAAAEADDAAARAAAGWADACPTWGRTDDRTDYREAA